MLLVAKIQMPFDRDCLIKRYLIKIRFDAQAFKFAGHLIELFCVKIITYVWLEYPTGLKEALEVLGSEEMD
jgi:hypothetical protein